MYEYPYTLVDIKCLGDIYNNVRRIVGTDDNIRVDTTGLIYESNVAVDVATRVRYNKENN